MSTIEMPSASAFVPRKATRKDWLGLAVIALPCMLYSMDLTVLNLAVPQIDISLRPSAAQMLWIVDIYGFMVAGALITMGTLGDRIGRRRLLMIGAVAFGAASVLAAFSTSATMLIVARALLGLAAATLAPSTLSLISNMFHDARERTFAISVWIASFSAGAAIGPVVGGVLLNWFWWGSVFLIAVPVMVLLLVLAPLLLPEYRSPEAGRLDLTSAALSVLAVLGVIYGVKAAAEGGLDMQSLAIMAAGLTAGWIFVRRQTRLDDPLIDLSLLRVPAFSASLGVNLVSFFVAFGSFLLIALYLQLVLGLSPLMAGIWSLPSAVGFIIGAMAAPAMVGSVRPAYLMATGLTVAACGFALLSVAAGAFSLPLTVSALFILSIGLAPVFTLATDLIIGAAPGDRAGSAAGMAETSSELGGALGIALLGSLVTALYRLNLGGAMPENTAMASTGTVGTALVEAEALGGSAGETLAAAARVAFAEGMSTAAMICAAIALLAAGVTARVLRRVGQ
ncbi:MFS transporter [Chelativorans sp. ZYF759]|uniref:MFS transporter n=1 Tax=Chelativorans sp. ZYF759 TaxID=2692213 RepID=UPI001FED4A73|nr:MFS transporter [Chelativorans sp. ZYF759]